MRNSWFLILTLFRMGVFGAAHRWGAGGGGAKRHTYITLMKLGPVVPNLKKIQKIHKSCGTTLEFC